MIGRKKSFVEKLFFSFNFVHCLVKINKNMINFAIKFYLNMKRYSLTLITIFVVTILSAQLKSDPQAIAILDNASNKINKATYSINIKMSLKEPENDKVTVQNMKLMLAGNKFYIKSNDIMEIFFNGTTQWVYFSELNEVTITNPTAKELQDISPMAIIKNYKDRYKVNFEQELNTPKQYAIALIPNNKNEDVFRIRIFINKSTNEVSKIESAYRNGQRVTFDIDGYKTVSSNSDTFSFNIKKYPNVFVNDLR